MDETTIPLSIFASFSCRNGRTVAVPPTRRHLHPIGTTYDVYPPLAMQPRRTTVYMYASVSTIDFHEEMSHVFPTIASVA